MTPRERVLAVLNGQRPDRVPWFGDLDYWATALIGRGEKPPDFKPSDAYLDWHRDLGVGFYLQGYFPFRAITDHCRVREWNEGNLRRRQIETPCGTLRETWTWLPESFAEAPTEHLVKSASDLRAYRYFHENTRYEPDYAFAERRRQQVGDLGVVLCYLPKSPLMQLIALDAGVTTVFEIFTDAGEEFHKTLEVVRRSHDAAARLAVESPAEVLMIPENLSSECVGKTFYEMFMRDYEETWARRIREAGKFSCIHLDGTMKGLLRETCSTSLTFIEALTPAPAGDLEIEKWAECSGNSRTILWGGLPGIFFTGLVSDEDFDAHVRHVLEVMRSEPRYVLGVADQVPPDGLERRVRRVRELVEEYGACASI
jgi:uroporphyrinogen-III decarboxylase